MTLRARITETNVRLCREPRAWKARAWSLHILATDGLPVVVEFLQSPQRMTPVTTGLYEAVMNGAVTHTGDPGLAASRQPPSASTGHLQGAQALDQAVGPRRLRDHGSERRRNRRPWLQPY
jgi:hypothetical protein